MAALLTPGRFLLQLVRPHWVRLLIGLAAMLVTSACMLIIPQYLRRVFDAAITDRNFEALNWLMLESSGMVALLAAGVFVRTICQKQMAHSISWLLVNRVYRHLLVMQVGFFERRSSGDIIARATSDTMVIHQFLENGLPMMVRGAFLAVGAYGVLLFTNLELTLVLSVTAPLLAVITIGVGRTWKGMSRQLHAIGDQSFARIEETVYGIRVVKAYGAEARENDSMMVLRRRGLALALKLAKWRAGFFAFVVILGFSSVMLVVWLGGKDVIDGTMSLGALMAFLLYVAFLGDGLSNLTTFWPMLQTAMVATERVLELLREEPTVLEPAKPKTLPKAKGKARGVSFEGVGFAYPSRPEVAVADGISFKVKAGQKVAVVGPSGAGKTTLFGLLLRFYDVQAGRIAVDGVDIRDLSFADLRRSLAVVAQEASIFSASVRDNVAYGKPEADEADVWRALEVAHADGFVKALPQGLDTPVGEKGVQLSGGQRQRLAIARAVLVDAPVLLLDEATSHLDAESERAVQAALEEAGEGRTVITIAHRLSTVRAADVIYVLDKGRVVAQGSHSELMKKSSLYKALASLQMA
jgi:ATP-binding cassette subfamily B protein